MSHPSPRPRSALAALANGAVANGAAEERNPFKAITPEVHTPDEIDTIRRRFVHRRSANPAQYRTDVRMLLEHIAAREVQLFGASELTETPSYLGGTPPRRVQDASNGTQDGTQVNPASTTASPPAAAQAPNAAMRGGNAHGGLLS